MILYGLSFRNGGSNAPGFFFVSSTNPETTIAVGRAKSQGRGTLVLLGGWHDKNPRDIKKRYPAVVSLVAVV